MNYSKIKRTMPAVGAVGIALIAGQIQAQTTLTWDGGGADSEFTTAENWDQDLVPTGADTIIIDGAFNVESSFTTSVRQTAVQGGATLNIFGGILSDQQAGNGINFDVGNGSVGVVNVDFGATHSVGHGVRIGNGVGGDGTYNIIDGLLTIGRASNSTVDPSLGTTSLDLGSADAPGVLVVGEGTSFTTRFGVAVGALGSFEVRGWLDGSVIGIGTANNNDGFWLQDAGTIKAEITFDGVTPIQVVDNAGNTEIGAGNVTLGSGVLVDVAYIEGADYAGSWDLLICDGTLTDNGVSLAPGVDSRWTLSVVDTDASGTPDTLRVTSSTGDLLDGTFNQSLFSDLDVYFPGLVSHTQYELADRGDPDGDGVVTWQELLDGTDPNEIPTPTAFSFDDGGVGSEFTTPENWDNDFAPNGNNPSPTTINGAFTVESSFSSTQDRLSTGGGATLNINAGVLNSTQSGSGIVESVGNGSIDVINQTGGVYSIGHRLQLGNGVGGDATYNLSGGDLIVSRGGTSPIDLTGDSTSLDVGTADALGAINISGGSLATRVGAAIGAMGTFHVDGSGASSIGIGSNGSVDGFFDINTGGTLKAGIDAGGATPIVVDITTGTGLGGGNAIFAAGSLLDVAFLDSLDIQGSWDLMICDGTITDNGIAFAPGVDPRWSFAVVDTNTLRVTSSTGSVLTETSNGTPFAWLDGFYSGPFASYTAYEQLDISDTDGDGLLAWQENALGKNPTVPDSGNGIWINLGILGDIVVESWTTTTNWDGGIVPNAPATVADFFNGGNNYAEAQMVDLPIDVTIGELIYRDSGVVDKNLTLQSGTANTLTLDAVFSTPKITALTQTITLDVVLEGTDGVEFTAGQPGQGITLTQANLYSGTTTVTDGGGNVTTVAPGDFGDSDLVVEGTALDEQADVTLNHNTSLKATASLTVNNGATVALNFANTSAGSADDSDLFLASLTLGGVSQPDGVYNETSHPDFLSGTGEIVVGTGVSTGPFQAALSNDGMLTWDVTPGKTYDVYQSTTLDNWTLLQESATSPYDVTPFAGKNFFQVVETP